MNHEHICKKAIEIVKQTAEYIIKEKAIFTIKDARYKTKNDLVSYIDLEAEKMLIEQLGQLIPDSKFITEEGHPDAILTGQYTWIIDPLDGTTNFIHGFPVYSISVALNVSGKTVIGIVMDIEKNECFYSHADSQFAFMNDQKINVSETPNLNSSLISTGFPYTEIANHKEYIVLLSEFMKKTHGIRRLGSAALDLAYVACGRTDAYFEMGLSPWDVAAGAYIVEKAGGIVTDFTASLPDKGNYLTGRQIIAANPDVFKEVKDLINNVLG